ncbi:hypothetical protein ACFLZ8_03945 [Planctomycetota bacterium]
MKIKEFEVIHSRGSQPGYNLCSNVCKEVKFVKNKMDELIQQKLNMYIGKLNEIKAIVQNEQTAAILLLLTEINQDRYRGQRNQKVVINGNAPATENQKAYLLNLGAAVPENLTKQQASILIDQAKIENQSMKNALRMPIRIP